MRRALALLLLLLALGCFLKKPPVVVPPPVVHVAAGQEIPEYTWKPGPNGMVCLTFDDWVANERLVALLFARLDLFKTLLKSYGVIFDPPAPEQSVAAPTPPH